MAQRTVSSEKGPKKWRNNRSKVGPEGKGSAIDAKSEFNLEVSFSTESAFLSNTSCVSPSSSLINLNRRLELSSMNVYRKLRLQSTVYPENPLKKMKTFEDPSESIKYGRGVRGLESSMDYGNSGFGSVNHLYVGTSANWHSMVDSSATEELEEENNSVKKKKTQARRRAEFHDQMRVEVASSEALKIPERRHRSKNIDAERKRRIKLKERLYALRALVPKITKMDRASIIEDAIEFVEELRNQVNVLQDELRGLEVEDEMRTSKTRITNTRMELPLREPKIETSDSLGRLRTGIRHSSASNEIPYSTMVDRVKVEVSQIDANKLFVNVLCEHKRHGFLRLMEVMKSLGLEVTNANITTCKGLVSNVLQVEMVESETLEADQLADLLAKLLQNAMSGRRFYN